VTRSPPRVVTGAPSMLTVRTGNGVPGARNIRPVLSSGVRYPCSQSDNVSSANR
jgi:hypothetical protein